MTQRQRRPAGPKTLDRAIRHFFGLRPNTNESEFRGELQQLGEVDRAWFAQALQDAGYRITPSTIAAD